MSMTVRHAIILPTLLVLSACEGRHNWLSGAGREASQIETLFWPLVFGAAVIWLLVVGLAIYAFRCAPEPETEGRARAFVLWGGAVFPTAVIAALLVSGLLVLRGIAAGDGEVTIRVDGEQWWWRVTYDTPEGPVTSANEVRFRAGSRTEILLTSDDVIHSFWVPALGGKIDMIPGRENRLLLTPETVGDWGGLCAEYCGGAHAQMRFSAIVMPPGDHADWLRAEARPAAVTDGPGLEVFLSRGCGACHAIRGTPAEGQVGPDLTHLAARTTLGAGVLPMTQAALSDWITDTGRVKPGVLMPGYPDLPEAELAVLLDYLMALE
ncbi:c-type cytochrome [Sulfitobacter sp. D35]|uniref:c-type cytochrome n=1 Tax=Sulfitobacter sp. D35 TaxID=3083252 RepID=UPI00296E63F2|nr:c-type cytochrome [Sulfitobacter sp. D35]